MENIGGIFMKRAVKKLTLLTSLMLVTGTTVALAQTYNDVPKSHWAYEAVKNVSEKGYILGDMNGDFNLNKKMDKFETAKIFARVAGYKYKGMTQEELWYYQRAYDKNKDLLNAYNSKYVKWNTSSDREIAYLLEKNILSPGDLNDFIVSVNGREGLKAITKEEVAYVMTKAIGKDIEANSTLYTHRFYDDNEINEKMKNNIYYLNKKDVLNGDTSNKLNPKKAVTKAEFSMILHNVLTKITDIDTIDNVSMLNGTIEKVYANNNIITVKKVDGKVITLSVSQDAVINIDGQLRVLKDLKKGDLVTISVQNNQKALRINGFTSSGGEVVEIDESGMPRHIIDGIITLNTNNNGKISLTIDSMEEKLDGSKKMESYVYRLSNNSEVYKNKVRSTYGNIKIGDIARAEVVGNTIMKIEVSDPTRVESGELLEKRVKLGDKYPVLVVELKNGEVKEFIGTKDSSYHRGRSGSIHFTQLLIGDKLDIQVNYNEIVNVYATGVSSRVEGRIQKIVIDKNDSYIEVVDIETKEVDKYTIRSRNINLYDLRLGSIVEIRLDSKEVARIDIIENVGLLPITGVVTDVNRNDFVVYTEEEGYITVNITVDTKFIDASRGVTLNYRDLDKNDNVLVYFTVEDGNNANTVSILPE